jgi:hypothetical protein
MEEYGREKVTLGLSLLCQNYRPESRKLGTASQHSAMGSQNVNTIGPARIVRQARWPGTPKMSRASAPYMRSLRPWGGACRTTEYWSVAQCYPSARSFLHQSARVVAGRLLTMRQGRNNPEVSLASFDAADVVPARIGRCGKFLKGHALLNSQVSNRACPAQIQGSKA